jgi:hypothetical protein
MSFAVGLRRRMKFPGFHVGEFSVNGVNSQFINGNHAIYRIGANSWAAGAATPPNNSSGQGTFHSSAVSNANNQAEYAYNDTFAYVVSYPFHNLSRRNPDGTWKNVTPENMVATGVACDQGSTVYCVGVSTVNSSLQLRKSTDNGDTWATLNVLDPNDGAIQYAYNTFITVKISGAYIYVFVTANGTQNRSVLWSNNDGASWTTQGGVTWSSGDIRAHAGYLWFLGRFTATFGASTTIVERVPLGGSGTGTNARMFSVTGEGSNGAKSGAISPSGAMVLLSATRSYYSADGVTWNTGVAPGRDTAYVDTAERVRCEFLEGYFWTKTSLGLYRSTNGAAWTQMRNDTFALTDPDKRIYGAPVLIPIR